jgi:hypothetical protein
MDEAAVAGREPGHRLVRFRVADALEARLNAA